MQIPPWMLGISVVVFTMTAGSLHAQPRIDPPLANMAVCGDGRIIPCPWTDLVQYFEEVARPRLVDYSRPDRDYPQPETAEQKQRPLLNREDTEAVVLVGAIAGVSAWCEVTTERVVLGRLLERVETLRKLSDVSFAYLLALSNVAASWYRRTSEKIGELHGERTGNDRGCVERTLAATVAVMARLVRA
jgi:hypothetical protein